MYNVVGTCGRCGGRVTVPAMWNGVEPPVPTCESCHARVKQAGPVLEMEPRHDPGDRQPWLANKRFT